MKSLIIDASVAIKWFIPEDDSRTATDLITGKSPMLAPDLIRPEIGNILWKLHRRGLLETDQVQQIMSDFLMMPIEIHDSETLILTACEIALDTGNTVYDCLYLALALQTEGTMITADAKLTATLQNTVWEPFIHLLA